MKAERICINRKGFQITKKDANFVTLFYEVTGNWINLNKELLSFGFAYGRSLPMQTAKTIREPRVWMSEILPKLGSVFVGTVTCINHDGEFFLHNVKSQSILISIRKLLNDAYNDSEPTKLDLQCRPGDLCIAR